MCARMRAQAAAESSPGSTASQKEVRWALLQGTERHCCRFVARPKRKSQAPAAASSLRRCEAGAGGTALSRLYLYGQVEPCFQLSVFRAMRRKCRGINQPNQNRTIGVRKLMLCMARCHTRTLAGGVLQSPSA